MEKENLTNIEEDSYEPRAGEAVRKYFEEDEIRFEHHFNDYNKNNAGYHEYVKCFEDEAVTCDTLILIKHFIAGLCAFQRHIQEEHGKLEETLEQLKPKL